MDNNKDLNKLPHKNWPRYLKYIILAVIIIFCLIILSYYFFTTKKNNNYYCKKFTAETCPLKKCEVGRIPCPHSNSNSDFEIGPCMIDICVDKKPCNKYLEKECIEPKCDFFENKCYQHTYDAKKISILTDPEIPKEIIELIPPEATIMTVNKYRSEYTDWKENIEHRFIKTDGNGNVIEYLQYFVNIGGVYICDYSIPFPDKYHPLQKRVCPINYKCVKEGASPYSGSNAGTCQKE